MRLGPLAIAVLLLGSVGTCAQKGTDMPITIEEAKARHADSLLALPGVVSVGIGRDGAGNPAIIIGLDRARQPGDSLLPSSLEGHPVVVQVIGEIRGR